MFIILLQAAFIGELQLFFWFMPLTIEKVLKILRIGLSNLMKKGVKMLFFFW